MNKKLFFAGFALLAAVSFTSCNSDNPIDITNPNGVTPSASTHYLGGSYDWTAIAKDNAELTKFWNEDATKVADAIKDKKTINILLDVSGFELDGTTIALPDFWKNNGTGAKDKVVNITISGNFKKADFERVEAMKATPAKFPVIISTNNLKGAEVNFTFDAEAIDLHLFTELTRSTLNGSYIIGYMYFEGAQNLSAIQVKGGIVEAIDLASSGDVEEDGGDVLGAWYKGDFGKDAAGTPRTEANIWVKNSGIGLGDNQKVVAKNLAVEVGVALDNLRKVAKDDIRHLDLIQFVKKNVQVTLGGITKEPSVTAIVGVDEATNHVNITNATDLKNIESLEKVTINNGAIDLDIEKDIFTDVTFQTNSVNFSVDKINTLEKVTFSGLTDVNIGVKADDQTLTFNGVKFNQAPTLYSENEVTLDADTYAYEYYQWVIDDNDPTQGAWVAYDGKAKNLKEYNVGKTQYEFTEISTKRGKVVKFATGNKSISAGDDATADDKANIAAAKNLFKITVVTKAGTKVALVPANFNIVMDGNCKFWDLTTDASLNNAWGYKQTIASSGTAVVWVGWADVAWYGVKYNNIDYKWTPYLAGSTFGGYILMKAN